MLCTVKYTCIYLHNSCVLVWLTEWVRHKMGFVHDQGGIRPRADENYSQPLTGALECSSGCPLDGNAYVSSSCFNRNL